MPFAVKSPATLLQATLLQADRGAPILAACTRPLASRADVPPVPPARHLLHAKDLADARHAEPLGVDDLARAAGLSRAHFSAEFRRAFGETPHAYLLTRRLERAATLLRTTDHSVAEICMDVGLSSVGSFTTSFTRIFGRSPTAYRAAFPAASDLALIPRCVLRAYGRPQNRTFREDDADGPFVASAATTSTRKETTDDQDREHPAVGA